MSIYIDQYKLHGKYRNPRLLMRKLAYNTRLFSADNSNMKLIISLFISLCLFNVAHPDSDRIASLTRATGENPSDFESVADLVEIFIAQRNFTDADYVLSGYLNNHEINARAAYLKARIYDQTENISEAMQFYQKAIELDSTMWRAYRDLAYLYDIFSDNESMNALFKKAIQFAPTPESIYYDCGYTFDMTGQLDSARYYYQKAIDFDSLDYQAILNLGAIMGLSGNLDSAATLLQKAVDINPESPESFYNLGEINLSLGYFDKAAGNFQQALALDPGIFAAKKRLGDLYEIMGDSGMAKIYYEDFLDSAPPLYVDDINSVREKLNNYR